MASLLCIRNAIKTGIQNEARKIKAIINSARTNVCKSNVSRAGHTITVGIFQFHLRPSAFAGPRQCLNHACQEKQHKMKLNGISNDIQLLWYLETASMARYAYRNTPGYTCWKLITITETKQCTGTAQGGTCLGEHTPTLRKVHRLQCIQYKINPLN